MKTNARLLKQSTEKDDMNAKSLSTILHLKHLTEQYEHEKALLEQEAKSAGQVSLAARLATNAKERVAEEALKEQKVRSVLCVIGMFACPWSFAHQLCCNRVR